MNILILEVKCKVNPQLTYTRYVFWSYAAVYLGAAIDGVGRNKYDSPVC